MSGAPAALETVYPRVCGGTLAAQRTPGCSAGLSPRVRGNHDFRVRPGEITGSIPACAGEPRGS